MKRSELKRRTPLKRTPPKPKARIPHNVRRAVNRRQGWRCLVCLRHKGAWPLQVHHVLPQSKWPEHDGNPFNLVAICEACHERHTSAFRRIRWDELPQQTRTWINTLGGVEILYAEKTYRV